MIARNALVSALAAAALAGCSWSSFDDLANQAWVDSSSAPGDLNSDDYGIAVAAGGDTGTDGVAFMVVGLRPDGVVQLDYAASGDLTQGAELISASASSPDPLVSDTPLVGDPTSTSGAVAVGLSESNQAQGRIILFERGAGAPHAFDSVSVGTGAVDVIGFGPTDNPHNPGTTNLVAIQDNVLSLIASYDASATRSIDTCRLGREQGYAVAVAEVDSSSASQELVVAMGNTSQADAPSEIHFMNGALIVDADASSTSEVECLTEIAPRRDPLFVLDPPGAEPDFGAVLQVADFDGNGITDLAVAAPRSNAKVYVYMNIDLATAGPSTPIEIAAPAGSASFGDSLTAGDFDGDGHDELVVGDSAANVDGNTAAGRAYIYVHNGSGFAAPRTLGDAQPEANQRFGRAMTVANWAGNQPILVVAAESEIFTYFRTPVTGDADVRE